MTTLTIGDTYRVDGWNQSIAVQFVRYTLEYPEHHDVLICDDDGCDHVSEMCWMYCDGEDDEPTENVNWAIVRMVGDDRLHEVESSSLIPVDADSICSCGQIGCHA